MCADRDTASVWLAAGTEYALSSLSCTPYAVYAALAAEMGLVHDRPYRETFAFVGMIAEDVHNIDVRVAIHLTLLSLGIQPFRHIVVPTRRLFEAARIINTLPVKHHVYMTVDLLSFRIGCYRDVSSRYN